MSPTEDKQQQKLREKQQKQKAKDEQQSDYTDFTDEKDDNDSDELPPIPDNVTINGDGTVTVKPEKSQEAQQNSTDTGIQDNTETQPEQSDVQEDEEPEGEDDNDSPDLTPDKTIADTGLSVEQIQDDQDFPDDNPDDDNKEGKTAQVLDPKDIDAEDTLNIESPLEHEEPEVLPKKYDDNGTLNIEDLPEKLDVDIQSESDTLSNMDNPTESTDTSGVYDDRNLNHKLYRSLKIQREDTLIIHSSIDLMQKNLWI